MSKNIQIIIDSTVDMAERLKSRIISVPLIVSFGEKEFLDGIDLSRDDFYRELESGQVMPKTSQPPSVFKNAHAECMASFNSPVDFFNSTWRVSSFETSFLMSSMVMTYLSVY